MDEIPITCILCLVIIIRMQYPFIATVMIACLYTLVYCAERHTKTVYTMELGQTGLALHSEAILSTLFPSLELVVLSIEFYLLFSAHPIALQLFSFIFPSLFFTLHICLCASQQYSKRVFLPVP